MWRQSEVMSVASTVTSAINNAFRSTLVPAIVPPQVNHAVAERIETIRHALADALRDRVIGDDADTKRAAIVDAPGERMFAPTDAIVRVHGDSSMFIGGMRALLLQSLHPLAMAGVAQHSDYRNDPWGRLQRTADFLAATTFGPVDVAQHAIDRVNAIHGHVVGTTSFGENYSARDPHLLRWVHIAEVDSFLRAHQVYGEHRLTDTEADEYVAQMAVIARKLGVPAPPTSVRGLRDQLLMYRHELRSTAESRDAARYLLLEPPLEWTARVPYGLIAAAAIAILPAWARTDLRLPYLPVTERFVVQPIGRGIASAIRWAIAGEESYAVRG